MPTLRVINPSVYIISGVRADGNREVICVLDGSNLTEARDPARIALRTNPHYVRVDTVCANADGTMIEHQMSSSVSAQDQMIHVRLGSASGSKGVLLGDSIVSNLFTNARSFITASSSGTVFSLATAGHLINDQLNSFNSSSYKGDPTIDWFYVMVGINDVLGGGANGTVAAITASYLRLRTAISSSNPDAVIFWQKMDPCKSRLDATAADRYPIWVTASNFLMTTLTGSSVVSDAMNNGSDSLLAQFSSSGDNGLHPTLAGDQTSSMTFRTLCDLTFKK